MKTKQEIKEYIQRQYDIGDNADQEFFGWASDVIFEHTTSLSFVRMLENELEYSETSSLIHYHTAGLINFIKGI